MKSKTVCVLGLGYIGLPTAALLASRGYQVVGVDVKADVVDTINQGKIHIVEPDLDTFVRAAVESGKLRAYVDCRPADVFMICVPTPFKKTTDAGYPQPNIDFVIAAARSIAPFIKPGNIVILESTSPVGTTEIVYQTLLEEKADLDNVAVAYCPERVLPGKIMYELVQNDRIVGGINAFSTEKAREFYQTFVHGSVVATDSKTAEMAKLTENSFRDVNIAFANELSMICEKFGIDVWRLIELANRHPRVRILQPGAGVGGHCIAVDPWFIVSAAPDEARLIRTAREVNNSKSEWVVERVRHAALAFRTSEKREPTIACFGLAFKPNIDDLRESPAVEICERLIEERFSVVCVEPNISTHETLELVSIPAAIERADIIVALVKHNQFLKVDYSSFTKPSGPKSFIDICGVSNAPGHS